VEQLSILELPWAPVMNFFNTMLDFVGKSQHQTVVDKIYPLDQIAVAIKSANGTGRAIPGKSSFK